MIVTNLLIVDFVLNIFTFISNDFHAEFKCMGSRLKLRVTNQGRDKHGKICLLRDIPHWISTQSLGSVILTGPKIAKKGSFLFFIYKLF